MKFNAYALEVKSRKF